jgi:hypothetical protein
MDIILNRRRGALSGAAVSVIIGGIGAGGPINISPDNPGYPLILMKSRLSG